MMLDYFNKLCYNHFNAGEEQLIYWMD